MKSTLVFCGNGIEKAPFDNYFIVIRYIAEGGTANLMKNQIEKLLNRYPVLESCSAAIEKTVEELTGLFRSNGTFFTCGNGGSAADCDHICGEFLKGFVLRRELPEHEQAKLEELFGEDGVLLGERLQRGLRAISLLSHPGFTSAFCNDVDPNLVFAQQLYALGTPGDILLGISTGGGAVNVRYAMMAAKLKKIKTILLTGSKHGACERYADIVIAVPETETYRIQELHLPVYHAICLAVEENMFGGVSL